MKIDVEPFRVKPNERLSLARRPTLTKPLYKGKDDYEKALRQRVKALSDQQQVFYADNRHALLLIFQAMDTAGKDGAIRHVLSGINPQGCQVHSFKHPSARELEHDFLWRHIAYLPERGNIGVFNRSYYEEVLIVRVHPELLRAEQVPDRPHDGEVWKERYESIAEFEQHLCRNGTKVVKVFLHLSKEEQRQRFISRIDEAEKNWKFNDGDIAERRHWDDYMQAYRDCIAATSSDLAPWYVVPADDKKNARLIIAQLLLDAIEQMNPAYPTVTDDRRRELALMREALEAEETG